MNRKTFLKNSLNGIALIGVTPALPFSEVLQEPKPISINLAKEFVVAGHKNLPVVKEMLNEYPNLLYASYDWGGSDYEQAIDGASHLGNKEIVNYLISKGARVNLFTLTMLGKIDFVKPVLESYPELVFAKGPHGFTLLHHANVGGAQKLSDYLKDKGLKDTFIKIK